MAQHQSNQPPPRPLQVKAAAFGYNEKKEKAPSGNFMAAEASAGWVAKRLYSRLGCERTPRASGFIVYLLCQMMTLLLVRQGFVLFFSVLFFSPEQHTAGCFHLCAGA